MADVKPANRTVLPPEILACRCLAAVIIIPLFIPVLHKPLRRLLRSGVSKLSANCLRTIIAWHDLVHAAIAALGVHQTPVSLDTSADQMLRFAFAEEAPTSSSRATQVVFHAERGLEWVAH